MVEENRDEQHFASLDCAYEANAVYNAAKTFCEPPSRAEASAGAAFCQYPLKSGIMSVNATEVASDICQSENLLTSPPLQRGR